MEKLRSGPPASWNEVLGEDGYPRPAYGKLLSQVMSLRRPELRRLDDGLEATMREMGVTFSLGGRMVWGHKPWECDLLPQVFSALEWNQVSEGVQQRLRAFEFFLQDVYGEKGILHDGILPVQVVLGSEYFQRPAATRMPRPSGFFLHLSGLALSRMATGELAVQHHYFGNASGISYMMQNRRALSRIMTRFFSGYSIRSISDAPTEILEVLRQYSGKIDPMVVLLSPGEGSKAYSEHSFLARRMGIPVVQGRDLLVHQDCVFLKTISGLERVEAIYTRVADPWIDPLVFRPDSLLGVPGLAQCIRKGTVQVLNAIGSQLADDRAFLPFSNQIIRYYLGELPILPTVPTYWLGDLDQREQVLGNLEEFSIRPLYGERILTPPPGEEFTESHKARLLKEITPRFSSFVAQPRTVMASTVCFPKGEPVTRLQDHIVFALRGSSQAWGVFPGALTRVSSAGSAFVASELDGGSKDTWVLAGAEETLDFALETPRHIEIRSSVNYISSRVAESFYWTGRYLERASSLANMIGTIESLEMEELNPTERKLYRPVWNQMLPPLETQEQVTKRTLSSAKGRYLLTLDARESGSLISSIMKAAQNADAVQESMSVEASSVLSELQSIFVKAKFRISLQEEKMAVVSRRLSEGVRTLVPQFFGVAEATMISDGGWRFCLIGQLLERAIVTANALASMCADLANTPPTLRGEHALEIRLSAFLRLLTSRDAYRRIYQMRIEPANVATLLWDNPTVPRGVRYCLGHCARLLRESGAEEALSTRKTLQQIEQLLADIRQTHWELLFEQAMVPSALGESKKSDLEQVTEGFLFRTHELHTLLTDGFLNHQIHMQESPGLPKLEIPNHVV